MIAPHRSADGVQVWVATQPVDMRKGFDGLAEVVRAFLGHDPLSGSLFVFRNRSAQRLKVLWYDRDGLTLYYKRLDRGSFRFPAGEEKAIAIDGGQLLRLLSGLTVVTTGPPEAGRSPGSGADSAGAIGATPVQRAPCPARANSPTTRPCSSDCSSSSTR